jgi:hypothetical protein
LKKSTIGKYVLLLTTTGRKSGNEIALGQRKVDEKSNAITAIPELLKMLAAGN